MPAQVLPVDAAALFMPRLIAAIGGFDRWKLEGHREMLKRKLTHEQWVSMNTDGPCCTSACTASARRPISSVCECAPGGVGVQRRSLAGAPIDRAHVPRASHRAPMGLAPHHLRAKA